jgi:hypothetical protein
VSTIVFLCCDPPITFLVNEEVTHHLNCWKSHKIAEQVLNIKGSCDTEASKQGCRFQAIVSEREFGEIVDNFVGLTCECRPALRVSHTEAHVCTPSTHDPNVGPPAQQPRRIRAGFSVCCRRTIDASEYAEAMHFFFQRRHTEHLLLS